MHVIPVRVRPPGPRSHPPMASRRSRPAGGGIGAGQMATHSAGTFFAITCPLAYGLLACAPAGRTNGSHHSRRTSTFGSPGSGFAQSFHVPIGFLQPALQHCWVSINSRQPAYASIALPARCLPVNDCIPAIVMREGRSRIRQRTVRLASRCLAARRPGRQPGGGLVRPDGGRVAGQDVHHK